MPPAELFPPQPRMNRRSVLKLTGATLGAVWLGGCASKIAPRPAPSMRGRTEPSLVLPTQQAPHGWALVLSGGSARGFAHIGVLRVLERIGLRPDLVVGSSAGAIVGAMWASGMTAAQIEQAGAELSWNELLDFDPVRALIGGIGLGLMAGERLEQFLQRHLDKPMEQFAVPFAAVSTDMDNAETVVHNRGDAARAVRASCSVPVVYEPVRVGGRLLADGQIVSPLPVPTARLLGAAKVLAVDVIFPPQHAQMSNPASMLFQSLIVSGWRHLLLERAQADVLISPAIHSDGQLGLDSRGWLIAAGEKAASEQIGSIRSRVSN